MTKSNTTAAALPGPLSVGSSSSQSPKIRPSMATKKRLATDTSQELTVTSDQYQNVHYHKVTQRWQAWTNCMPGMSAGGASRGPYCGSHATEYLAARAQDRALLKLKRFATMPIRLNFPKADYADDEPLRATLTDDEFVDLLALEGRGSYKRVGATKCLKKFLAEEEALGNLPNVCEEGKRKYKVTSLNDHLVSVFLSRSIEEIAKLAAEQKNGPDELMDSAAENMNSATDLKWAKKRARSSRSRSTRLQITFPESVCRLPNHL